ncbi:MAG TPA: alpha-L-arabinofuranosidase C-terminal domain-containing protein [Acidobacteriaceae bacterium]|jgi:alpha-N-arabinofuranosidase|nr:alpha-L-arabinofuranosidase C-terminal domain-containing protein [Acidobacteriaceae bacterium]
MRKETFAVCGILVAAAAVCATAAFAQKAAAPAAMLTIQADKEATPVSPTLYGLMTEEINYSYDGGLYAEMVRNRTFLSDWSGINDWLLLEKGNAAASLDLDDKTGPSGALPRSLKVVVTAADAHSPAGVLNDGYWGMAVRPNTVYHGSFYAKSTGPDAVTASLVNDASGRVLAQATVPGIGSEWKPFTFVLKTGAVGGGAGNHLELTVARPGTLWLQLVSLFPPTYHDRANGNRPDLMEKLAAMHPAFLRFPGGNYLEGDRIADRYPWKKTIGPLVDRPGHPSPWNYMSTDGMGLLEFLDWCEDLKMQPLLAVYAGYSLGGEHVNPGPDLDPYVQNALDEIEYVTGSADTQWGAERVKDGHPQPFHLTYVEIGNEDWFDKSGSYDGRYAQFYKAIKAKYPDLQLIATAPVKGVKPDVLDEHYYLRATQFFHDATHYDKTDRSGPKIFVGEWATREGRPTPNFGAALGDAAWMTGLERNSDIVVMASYAPLFTNVNPGGLQWDPDLIGYNAEKSYGSPSYYAQVMFAEYLGNETPTSSLEHGGAKFFYSVTRDSAKKRLYLKLVNASSTAQPVEIKVEGGSLAASGKLVTLKAMDTQATNSMTDPTNIVPVDSTVPTAAGTLHHTMPPYSIQVLVLDEK